MGGGVTRGELKMLLSSVIMANKNALTISREKEWAKKGLQRKKWGGGRERVQHGGDLEKENHPPGYGPRGTTPPVRRP